jgi:hypothetical protein
MLTFLAKGTDSFDLPLGGVVATVSALPVQFEGPCSYVRYAMDDEAESNEEPDDFDESLADLDARGGLPDDDDEEDRE